MRVNSSSSAASICCSAPMISSTSPPEQNPRPSAGDHEDARVAAVGQLRDEVAQVRVRLEGERVELVRPRERERRHSVGDLEREMLPALGERRRGPERAHVWIPPPSITRVWPLIPAASGDASHTTAAATSPGSSSRPSGDAAARSAGVVARSARPLGDVGHRAVGHRRVHERRADSVGGHARARQLGGRGPHQAHGGVLGCGVGGRVRRTHTAGGRGDGDDAPRPRSRMPPTTARVHRNAPVALTRGALASSPAWCAPAARSRRSPRC